MERSNIIAKLYDAVKESEKDRLISSSGSTREGGNERIRSGQSYLYKLHGMESEVIEVRFQNGVWGSHLNVALHETMKRYPYFNTRLIEKEGDFYIVQNDIAPVARRTRRLYRLGGMGCNRTNMTRTRNFYPFQEMLSPFPRAAGEKQKISAMN